MIPHLDMSATADANGLVVRGPLGDPDWETRISVSALNGRSTGSTSWIRSVDNDIADRISWISNEIHVEYVLGDEGIRQNFIVLERSSQQGGLTIALDLTTKLCPEQEGPTGIAFRTPNGELRHAYRGLHVWDACGKVLDASMALDPTGKRLMIHVADEGAVYPVTVDPVSTTHDRQLAPPIGGDFGWSVASAGDLNGDGYSDVAVGAWSASSGQAGEGLVYVYYGSSSGIPAAPNVTLQEDQVSANFGWSVDGAGDVNGDGYSDLLVGATTWENNIATDKEGATFVYHGSAAGLSTVPAVILQSNATNQYMGYSVAGLGDINGDGYSDVGTGGHLAARGQSNEGVVWIFLGSAAGVNPVPRHILEQNQGAAQFGGSVSGAGDVNGDGYNDVIIGAHKYDLAPCTTPPFNTCDDGAIFVYHGSANALGAGANPAYTTRFNTAGYSVQTGWAVSTAGDVNGDGYSDVIVGDWRDDVGGPLVEGIALIYHGSAAGVVTVPATILQNNQADSRFGRSVSTAGDVNGDGYADVIVGSPIFTNGQSQEGAAFLYLGSPAGIASSAFIRIESDMINNQLGESVSTAGDVNGDGYSDLIIGMPNSGGGLARIYHGGTYNVSPTPSFTRASGLANAHLGWSVANAGDVNGDGYSDAIFGAPDATSDQANEGLAYVHYGSATGLSAGPNVVLQSNVANAGFGRSVASAGDVNGDGYADVIIGAPTSGGTGRAYVYRGSPAGIVTTPIIVLNGTAGSLFGSSVFKAGDVNADGYSEVVIGAPGINTAYIHLGSMAGLDPAVHATLTGVAGSSFGASVGTAGDVNGDGYSDVIVGAPDFSNPSVQEGAIYVYHGSETGISPPASWFNESNIANSRFGCSVAGASDINGDGYYEIIVGAEMGTLGQVNEGYVFIFYGTPSGSTFVGNNVLQVNQAGVRFGTSVSEAGDVNGDGYADVAIGAQYYGNGEANEGRTYVYLGTPTGIGTNASVEPDIAGARSGFSVAGGGDVDGDGYSDVLSGAPYTTGGAAQDGSVRLYRGNEALSWNRITRQYLADLVSPLSTNSTDYPNSIYFGIGHRARSSIQRTTGRLRWEVVHEGQPFSGGPITNSVSSTGISAVWTDLGLPGVQIRELIIKDPGFLRFKWRARVEYPMHKMIDGQRFSRWFYGYASAVGDIGILPVELTSFNGSAEDEGNLLIWTTASESGADRFIIERGSDGLEFTAIGGVPATGESSGLVGYRFMDADAPKGLSYYRLRAVDLDGSGSTSPVISILRNQGDLVVYPVPVKNELHWSLPGTNAKRAMVLDATGRVLVDVELSRNVLSGRSIQQLATGTYTLVLFDEAEAILARTRFVKH